MAVCFLVFIAFMVFYCVLCFSADDEIVSEYIIGVGDVIQVSVWQYDQFSTTATVGPDGEITVPLLGDIYVVGLTREEVKEDLAKKLSTFIKDGAAVTVSIAQFNSQKIHVFGQVRNPRTTAFSSAPSLLEIITQSQFAPEADLTRVKVIPPASSEATIITVDIAEVLRTGDISQLPELHPGYTVYIPGVGMWDDETLESMTEVPPELSEEETPQEKFTIHVMGTQVRRPASLDFAREPTLTEVLLQAGSVVDSMALRYVRIVRAGPTLGDRVVDVDLDKYLETGDDSLLPQLYSGDIVYIPDITQEKMKDLSIIITGQVLKPGTYRTRESLNILDAISLAGGLSANADPERIRIRKETVDSYHEKIVNIDEFLNEVGSISTPEMVEPGYRIYVPARRRSVSRMTSASRGLVAFLADLVAIYSVYRWWIR